LVPRGSIEYVSRSVQVPTNREVIWTPPCDPSDKAIGGGFSLGDRSLYLIRSQPNPGADFRKWLVKAGTRGVSARIGADSVCVREELVNNLKHLERTQAGTNVVNVGTERCPEGTYLLSGGGSTREGDAKQVRWSHIRPGGGSQADPPKDWAVGAVVDDLPGREKRMWSHALCGKLGDPRAVGGGAGGEEDNGGKNKKDNKKQGKHGEGIKVGKNIVKVGGIRIANGEVRVGSIRIP